MERKKSSKFDIYIFRDDSYIMFLLLSLFVMFNLNFKKSICQEETSPEYNFIPKNIFTD